MSDMLLPVVFYWACWDEGGGRLAALFPFDRREEAEEHAARYFYQIFPAVIQGAVVVKQP